MAYPAGITSKLVTGTFADFYQDKTDGIIKSRPKKGYVLVSPAPDEIRINATNVIYDLTDLKPQRVAIDVNGTFTFEAIVTDQAGITPNNGWTYKFEPSWGSEVAYIPIRASDPATININQYFGRAEVPGVIEIQGPTGRGIASITSVGTIATITYTDGSTATFSLPIGDGSETEVPDATNAIKGKILIAGDLTGSATSIVIGADKIDSTKLSPAVRATLAKADTAIQAAGLTKTAVGLGNVDNTSDLNKPVSNATQSALNLKVNITSLHAVATSGSYADLTNKPTIPSTKADIGLGNVDNTSDLNKPISTATASALAGKASTTHTHSEYVKTVNGTSPDGTGAVTVVIDWAALTGKPTTFTPTAHTHLWADITDKPTTFTPAAHVHAQTDITGLATTLAGKSDTTHVHAYSSLTGIPSTFAPSAHTHTAANISDSTTIGRSILLGADAASIRTIIGAGTSNLALGTTASTAAAGNHVHAYSSLTGIPSTFAPSAHSHIVSDVTGLQAALDAKAALTHSHATSDITNLDTLLAGKANVSALTSKADLDGNGWVPTNQLPPRSLIRSVPVADIAAMQALTAADVQEGDVAVVTTMQRSYMFRGGDPSNLDNWNQLSWAPGSGGSTTVQTVNGQVGDVVLGKSDVGLANVDNTSDLNKPISTAVTTALAGKASTSHTHVAADISNSTAVGRSVITATDAAAARAVIGAGTSNLALGTTNTTAKAGDYVPAWSEITSKPTTFAPSAHTHLWADLTDKPTTFAPIIGTTATTAAAGNHNHDAAYSAIGHVHAYSSLTGIPTTFAPIIGTTATTAAAGNHTHAGVYEPVIAAGSAGQYWAYDKTWQTLAVAAVSGAAPLASPALSGTPTAPTAAGGTNTTQIATTAYVVTGLAGKANTSHTHLWADITDKPTTFTPSTHSHAQSDITGLTASLAAKENSIAAGTTAQYYRGDKTWQTLDKAAVGLTNVDNTSDTTKFANTALTGVPTAPTATAGTNTTQLATTAYVVTGLAGKANSTHTHAQADITNLVSDLALKAPLANPNFTGTVTGVTKGMVGLGSADNTSDLNKPISNAQATLFRFNRREDYRPMPVARVSFADKADGILPNFDTGQTPVVGLNGVNPVTSSGRLIATGTGNRASYYSTPSLGANVTRVGARFVFIPQASSTFAGTACVAITNIPMDSQNTALKMGLHFWTTRYNWAVTVWDGSAGGQAVVVSEYYSAPLPTDGITEMTMEAWIIGNKCVFILPDGQKREATDARFSSFAGQYAFVETFLPNGTTDDIAAFSHFWVDTAPAVPSGAPAVNTADAQTIGGYKKFAIAPEAPDPYSGPQVVNRAYADIRYAANVLTGYVSSPGTVAATDTVLQAIQKLNGNDGQKAPNVLAGFVSGSGTVSASDTVLQAIQKLNGNDALKAPIANPTFTGTVSGVTATHVGLGNVNNTSDAAKPISTATQTALDLKANRTDNQFVTYGSNTTLTMPSSPVNGQMTLFEIRATAAITVTAAAGTKLTGTLTNTLAIGSGKSGFMGFRYSTAASAWYLLSSVAEA